MFFKIRQSQENLKIRDGTPLEAEEILTYIKSPRNGLACYFSSKLDFPSNVVQKKRVARILFFKIRPFQEILKIRDGTPFEAEEILTYIKTLEADQFITFLAKILKFRDGTPLEAEEIMTYIKGPRNGSVCYFSSKPSQEILKIRGLDVPSNVEQKKRVARILFFKIRPSQEILKIRDGTPLEAEEILTYIKGPRNGSDFYFSSKPSQEILKIRDGTPLEAEEILTYIKGPRNGSVCVGESLTYIKSPRNGLVCYFSSKLDFPSNVVHKKRVARILFFKIRPFQEILKIRDGVPLWRPSQEILKIRDGTPLEAEEILTYIKGPRNGSVCYFYSKLDVPSNVVQKKRVARIMFFKIRPFQEILKIRDDPFGGGGNFDIHKKPSKRICLVAQILFFKIRPSQEILKIRDGTPLEAEEILTYIKVPRNGSVSYFSSKQSQENLKIRDGTPLEAEEILTYIKSPRNGLVCYFSSKLDFPSNVVQKKRVARILFFKIRPFQEILKIRDGTPFEAEEILTYIKTLEADQFITFLAKILKFRDGTPLEAEEIMTYIKGPRNGSVCYFSSKLDAISRNFKNSYGSVCYFSSKLDVPSNVEQKKRVARILFFKIRPSQEILKIRDGTPLEAEEILTYIKGPRNGSDFYFSSKPSQEILKIRDGTPLEAEEILTYIKGPRNGSCGSVYYFSSKLDVPSNIVQKKRVARIPFFKIRPSQEILKFRDGTPLEAEEIMTYIKGPRNGSVCYFSSKLDVPINVVQNKKWNGFRFSKLGPRNGSVCYFSSKLDVPSNVVQKKKLHGFYPSQEILKIRDGTPLEADKLDVPSNVEQKKRVARILFFKIRPSQEILKIRDGTPLEAEEILTYIKGPRNGSDFYFSSKLDVPNNVVQNKKWNGFCFSKLGHLKKF
ncbi:hypothetical protein OROMI_006561 [Orobanche minor]